MLWLWDGHEEALLRSLEEGTSNSLSVFNLLLFNTSRIDGEEKHLGQYWFQVSLLNWCFSCSG